MNNIRIVEIELFNFCNRTCNWCPNKNYPERQDAKVIKFLDFEVLKKLISDLKKIGYRGVISFSRYNEPFYDFENNFHIFKYIKEELPNCRMVSNTNGDYINDFILNKASEIFSEITIMDYDNTKDESYYKIGDCEILISKPLFEINDRGGCMPEYSSVLRTKPCFEPKYFLAIDYTGDVMPCCNMRHESHSKYILGNIKSNSILEIMENDKRKSIMIDVPMISPCRFCIKKPGRHTRDVNPGIKF
ncbi:MAG: SPASM domain-containing protein [Fusobacteriaceae bacterium]